jgi:transcriptional regulator with XRE-family HTH domain
MAGMEADRTPHAARQPSERDRAIGRRLRAFRERRGLTQKELGHRCQVSFQQIQKYERGINRISMSRLEALAAAMDVTPLQLLSSHDTGPEASLREQLRLSIDQLRESDLVLVRDLLKRLS